MLDAGRPPAHRVVAHEPTEQERATHGEDSARIGALLLENALLLAAFEFLRHVRIAGNAVSLGGVENLTCHPKSTTHSGMSPEELAASGVTDGLVRVSAGFEDWRDLLADFEQALAQ